jgi:hypothetical protein
MLVIENHKKPKWKKFSAFKYGVSIQCISVAELSN